MEYLPIKTVKQGVGYGILYSLDQVSENTNSLLVSASTLFQMTLKQLLERKKNISELEVDFYQLLGQYLQDKKLILEIEKQVEQGNSLENAIDVVIASYIMKFQSSTNPVIQARVQDLKEVQELLLQTLHQREQYLEIQEDVILFGKTITMNQFLSMPKDKIHGVILEEYADLSHVAILLKACGIPIALGKMALDAAGSFVCLDTTNRQVIFQPKLDQINTPLNEKIYKIKRYLTLNSLEDMSRISEYAGVGLVRTEFLYLQKKDWPSSDVQQAYYRNITRLAVGKDVIFRTFDLGYDKQISYADTNGLRGIQFSFKYLEKLKEQIANIILCQERAKVGIMFPYVKTKEEVMMAKQILNDVYHASSKSFPFPRFGIMIETKEVLEEIEEIVPLIDFMSIGSNDLSQEILSLAREKIPSFKQNPNLFEPVLECMKEISSKKKTCTLSICGELGKEEELEELFIKLGFDYISI